jgi:hypothetical protein
VSDIFNTAEADRNAAQKVFVNFVEKVPGLGGKRAGARLRRGEDVVRAITKETKDFIVVKSGVVTLGNTISNMALLKMMGISLIDLVRDQAEGLDGVLRYQKDFAARAQLIQELAVQSRLGGDVRTMRRMERDIAELSNELEVNPVHPLVDAGVMQTIVEDIEDESPQFSFKSSLEEFIDSKTSHPMLAPAKKVARAVYLSHDQPVYKALNNAVRLSDFVARYALHKHQTQRMGMDTTKSLNRVVEIFINYDLPTHRLLQYGNDMGLLWFTKYRLRVQKVILMVLKENPANSLLVLLMQGMLGGNDNIFNSLAFVNQSITSVVGDPLTSALGASENLITLAPVRAAL